MRPTKASLLLALFGILGAFFLLPAEADAQGRRRRAAYNQGYRQGVRDSRYYAPRRPAIIVAPRPAVVVAQARVPRRAYAARRVWMPGHYTIGYYGNRVWVPGRWVWR